MQHKVIASVAHRGAGTRPIIFPIPARAVGLVIGNGGKTVQKARKEFGLERIHVDTERNRVEIYGEPVQAQLAKTFIKSMAGTIRIGDELTIRITRTSMFAYHYENRHVQIVIPSSAVPETMFPAVQFGSIIQVRIHRIEQGSVLIAGLV